MNLIDRCVAIQNAAYKVCYAKAQLEKSCQLMAEQGFCNHRDCGRNCDTCRLQRAHNLAVEEIKNGIRKAPKIIVEDHNYGATRYYKNGHKTSVWHDYKEVKK